MRIALEALAWGSAVNRFSQVWDIVQRADHPHPGVALDSFHTLAVKDDFRPIKDIPGECIFFVQLADAPWVNTDPLTHSRRCRCFPDQGEMVVTGFVGAVFDAGYTGPISLEIFNDEGRSAPARANASDAMRSLLRRSSLTSSRLASAASGIVSIIVSGNIADCVHVLG